ncbi:MAG: RNA-binding S4 domain-containing protein [Anaerovibrio sp.]
MEKIAIHTESIQLDQLLKWAGIIESGGQVKPMLEEKLILVNGNIETAKRRRLFPGDTVEIRDMGCWQVDREETGGQ